MDDPFLRGYISAALHYSPRYDEDGTERGSVGDDFMPSHIHPFAMHQLVGDAHDFLGQLDDEERDAVHADPHHAGVDFWLSRNGHSVGFFDGDYDGHERDLQRAAKSYGEAHLYVGDDGRVHHS